MNEWFWFITVCVLTATDVLNSMRIARLQKNVDDLKEKQLQTLGQMKPGDVLFCVLDKDGCCDN
jgi:hypothetical protein